MSSFSQGGSIGASQSDLTVEEQLAAGASPDDLVASGVLYDDYDPESDDYDFTPLEPVEVYTPGPPMSDEDFEASKKRIFRPFELAREWRKNRAKRDVESLTNNASD